LLERFKSLIFTVVIIAIAAGIVALLTYKPAPVVITINPPGPTLTPAPIRVYITGAVAKPLTTYALPFGSRVYEAINAAGGSTADADLVKINLAQVLNDGDQINVPSIQVANVPAVATESASLAVISTTPIPQATVTPAKATATTVVIGAIHINTATAEQLQALPGVGPVLAQAIIDYRTKNGPFKRMSDLDKVTGVGPAKLKDWDGLLVFD
jgi:competence protein ComEA